MKLFELLDKFGLKGNLVIGEVKDNKDPRQLRRVKASCSYYNGIPLDKLPWAVQLDVLMTGGNNSHFYIPEVGEKVVLYFPQDIYHPFYIAGVSSQPTVKHLQSYPEAYGFIDSTNTQFYIDRKTKHLEFKHTSGAKIHIYPNGDIEIYSPNEIRILADNHILIQANQVDINP